MPRKKAEPKIEAPVEAAKPGYASIAFVLTVLVITVALVSQTLSTGRLFVQVDTVGRSASDGAFLVCVYEGDVVEELRSGRAESIPQAIAAVTVVSGVETEVEGHWKGVYTLAVITSADRVDEGASVLRTEVAQGDTHIGFMRAQVQQTDRPAAEPDASASVLRPAA